MSSETDPGQRSSEQSKDWKTRVPFESFEGTAVYLGIPQESWEDPEIQRFVDLINRVNNLQRDLSIADTANSAIRVEKERYLELNVGLEPHLSDRYTSAELLMRSAFEILTQGFQGNIASPDYLQSNLNAAVNGYGLKVEKTAGDQPK